MSNGPSEKPSVEPALATVGAGVAFLAALFDETDTILFRPIETWVEAGKKRSRVDYHNTVYCRAEAAALETVLHRLAQLSDQERTNLFYGVCPRLGDGGRFDMAWQIRKARAIWTDIDHTTVDATLEQITLAGLPRPSIIVNSGNGVHCYWLLDCPYVIDDVGEPLAVELEWQQHSSGSKRRPRKYVVADGEKLYVDEQRHLTCLSKKAEHLQNVVAGVATTVGGDHTQDLARLLRIPGTLNRKDERNGRQPIATVLVECDSSRRYRLEEFERFASPCPEAERAKQIASMPIPSVRKPSSAKIDRLGELVAASSIAPVGSRSEADFSLCCYALKSGIERELVWNLVAQVGKFAERGRDYFDATWGKADFEVRASTLDKLQRPSKKPATGVRQGDATPSGLAQTPGRPIEVNPATMPVGDTLALVSDHLLATGNCFSRAEQLVVVHEQKISAVLAAAELAGLLNEHVEFFFISGEDGEFKPLPPTYGNTWIHNHVERARLPVIKLYTRNPVYSDDWRLVAPGYDPQSGIYYAGPAVEPRQGSEHLDALLRDFCFKSPADRTNYIGMLLTVLLVPRFIGSKPAALFNGNQPELGKSILAQIISILRDGQAAETASYNPNDEEFEKRLGAIVRGGATTIIIDNAKSRGRDPRIESACLERSITDSIISFRLLGQSASIRAENSHIFCVTANSASVSPDLVKRSVVINLYHEGDPSRRSFSINDPEDYALTHRHELLGELIGMVERWKASGGRLAETHSRFNKRGWGNIIGGILEASGEPDFLANAEEAAVALDETRREFAELVEVLADHPQGIWKAKELVELCCGKGLLHGALGDGSSRSQAT